MYLRFIIHAILFTGIFSSAASFSATAQRPGPDTTFVPLQTFGGIHENKSSILHTADGKPGIHYWQNRTDYWIAVKNVVYTQQDFTKGIDITISNLRSMVMPVEVEIRQLNGKVDRVHLPAQSFQSGQEYTFHHPTTTPAAVVLDPDRHLPDVDRSNNYQHAQ